MPRGSVPRGICCPGIQDLFFSHLQETLFHICVTTGEYPVTMKKTEQGGADNIAAPEALKKVTVIPDR